MAKPRTASGYDQTYVAHVRATCLYVATKLGDMLDDVVVVGGLVPSLIVDQHAASERHVGTADLDIGLALAVFNDRRYQVLTERLRQARFEPDKNDRGNLTRQRWKIDGPPTVTIDFLIAPTEAGDVGGKIKSIEDDFAAIVAPGLRLAFRDRRKVTLHGTTIRGESARREVSVCGAGAFVAMKALAFRSRGENKDAYDLVYLLRNHAGGIEHVAAKLLAMVDDAEVTTALAHLDEDFDSIDSVGPRRAVEFLHDGHDDEGAADAWGLVRALLDQMDRLRWG